jgi:hypothetical protein
LQGEYVVDVWGLTVAALRRWYILLPLLAISLVAAIALGSRAQSEYEVTGSVMLVAPPQENPNPFADDYASEILGIGLASSSTREDMANQGLSDAYELAYDRGSPIISMRVVAPTEALALQTADELVARLDRTLSSAQTERGIPRSTRVALDVVDAPDVAEPVVTGRLRLTAVIALAGGILSVACAVLADVILLRRRDRRQAALATEQTSQPKPAAEPPVSHPKPPQAGPRRPGNKGKKPRGAGNASRRPTPSKL